MFSNGKMGCTLTMDMLNIDFLDNGHVEHCISGMQLLTLQWIQYYDLAILTRARGSHLYKGVLCLSLCLCEVFLSPLKPYNSAKTSQIFMKLSGQVPVDLLGCSIRQVLPILQFSNQGPSVSFKCDFDYGGS